MYAIIARKGNQISFGQEPYIWQKKLHIDFYSNGYLAIPFQYEEQGEAERLAERFIKDFPLNPGWTVAVEEYNR